MALSAISGHNDFYTLYATGSRKTQATGSVDQFAIKATDKDQKTDKAASPASPASGANAITEQHKIASRYDFANIRPSEIDQFVEDLRTSGEGLGKEGLLLVTRGAQFQQFSPNIPNTPFDNMVNAQQNHFNDDPFNLFDQLSTSQKMTSGFGQNSDIFGETLNFLDKMTQMKEEFALFESRKHTNPSISSSNIDTLLQTQAQHSA